MIHIFKHIDTLKKINNSICGISSNDTSILLEEESWYTIFFGCLGWVKRENSFMDFLYQDGSNKLIIHCLRNSRNCNF